MHVSKYLHSNIYLLSFFLYLFFSLWVFFREHSRFTGLQGKGEGISLTPHYHFHLLQGHLDVSMTIPAGSSHLRIASSRTRTGNLWFLNASRQPLSYSPYIYIENPIYILKIPTSYTVKLHVFISLIAKLYHIKMEVEAKASIFIFLFETL